MKDDMIRARKKNLPKMLKVLSTIVGDLSSDAVLVDGKKVVTDDVTIAYLKKHIKNINEVLTHPVSDSAKKSLQYDKDIASVYIPQQISDEEYRVIYDSLANKELSSFMNYLKSSRKGLFDGKKAVSLWKKWN